MTEKHKQQQSDPDVEAILQHHSLVFAHYIEMTQLQNSDPDPGSDSYCAFPKFKSGPGGLILNKTLSTVPEKNQTETKLNYR